MQALHYAGGANDVNSPTTMSRMSSRQGSRASSPPPHHMPHVAPMTIINDSE
jgi:hypothetical protein